MTAVPHLYLHFPFCRTRCSYCVYPVTPGSSSDLDLWVDSLTAEFRLRGGRDLLTAPLSTLLVGGGTPSLFGAEGVTRIRDILGPELLDGIEEWTVEANPEDLTGELLYHWRAAGVTRPHLGVQSLDESALSWLGRAADPEVVRTALRLVHGAGFPSWGVDLLFGLPREVDPDPLRSAERVVATGTPHISLYECVVEDESVMARRLTEDGEGLPDEDEKAEDYLRMANYLQSEGYEAYEMTGFALPGHASLHAVALLEKKPYFGMGPAAESFIDGRLSRNLQDWSEYSQQVARGVSPEYEGIFLDSEEAHLLRIWSFLKLRVGLRRGELTESGRALCNGWVSHGLAHPDVERVALTFEGWLRLDELALELLRAELHGRGLPE